MPDTFHTCIQGGVVAAVEMLGNRPTAAMPNICQMFGEAGREGSFGLTNVEYFGAFETGYGIDEIAAGARERAFNVEIFLGAGQSGRMANVGAGVATRVLACVCAGL